MNFSRDWSGGVFFLCFFLFSVNTSAQSWLWAKQPVYVGNPPGQSDGEEYSVATDKFGNVYETGFFAYAKMFYGADSLTSVNSDFYLAKYDPNGNVIWATHGILNSGSDASVGYSVTTDLSGNVYAAGFIEGTVKFGSYTLTSAYGVEAFLVKYDPNGNVKWAKQSIGSGHGGRFTNAMGVTIDKSGNVYITGEFTDTLAFGTFSLNCLANFNNAGNVFLVKYDSSGSVLWAKQSNIPSSTSTGTGNSITCDVSGNLYVTGVFHDTLSFGSQVLISHSIVGEIFLVKYDRNGNVIWAKQSNNNSSSNGSPPVISGNGVTTDKAGNIYIAGNFEDAVTFGAYTLNNPVPFIFPYGDMLIVKYDPAGNVIWAKAGSPFIGNSFAGWAIAADTLNHLYFTGGGDVSGNPGIIFGADTFALSSAYFEFSLILKLDTGGNVLCGTTIPAGGDDFVPLAVDPSGKYIYTGGDFRINNINMGPDVLTLGSNPPNMGVEIPFVARWLPCNPSTPLSASTFKTNVSCHGQCNGTATATVSGGTPPYTYSWDTNPVQTTPTITGLCAGTYHVKVTDSSKATATSTISIIQPLRASAGSINSQKDTICAGTLAHLTLSSDTGILQWQSSISTSGGFSFITGATGGVYSSILFQTTYYRVVASNGTCTDTSVVFKENVIPSPVAAFSDSTSGHTVAFNSDSSSGADFYLWDFGDNTTSTAANTTHMYVASGTFHVCLTVRNNTHCDFTLCNNITILPTGINDVMTEAGWNIYPNPFGDEIIISRSGDINEGTGIILYDICGRVRFSKNYKTGEYPIKMDLSNLPDGFYYLKIETAGKYFYQPIIKQK